MRLKDSVAVITGAANGIGRETARLFAKEGAKVALADLMEESGQEVADTIQKEGGEAFFYRTDVSDESSVQDTMDAVCQQWDKIDILVNNAGITQDEMLVGMSREQWQKVMDVNLTGVFLMTQAAASFMLDRGRGTIINTSSVSGVYGNIGQTNYAAAKAGIVGMTKSWAKELGRKGIRVNAVAPGFVETGMVENVPQKVIDRMVKQVPLARLGRPSDIAKAYLYLASEDADYVNGTVLHVDGGIMM